MAWAWLESMWGWLPAWKDDEATAIEAGPGKDASIIEQRNNLISTWLPMKEAATAGSPPLISAAVSTEIDAKLTGNSTVADLNFAEQLMIGGLAGEALDAAIQRRLDDARRRGYPDTSLAETRFSALQATGTAAAKRAFLYSLVADLQHFKLRGAQIRHQRLLAIASISRWTMAAVFVAVLPFLAFLLFRFWPQSGLGHAVARVITTFPDYGLYTTVSFGALGALFSRYITFQADEVVPIPLDDAYAYYSRTSILLHILIGTMGATILYFIAASGMITSPILPDVRQLTFLSADYKGARGTFCDLLVEPPNCPFAQASAAPADPTRAPNGITTLLGLRTPNALVPSRDLALLIIWAILAGFSERLVPNLLDTAARQIQAAGDKPDSAPPAAPAAPPPPVPTPIVPPSPPSP